MSNIRINVFRAGGVALSLALLGATGCHTFKTDMKIPGAATVNKHMPWHDKDEPELGDPKRVVGTWVDTVMTKPGEKPQRGFGGRLIFYGEDDKEKPILVDGQIVVYAFDEANREETDNRPTRRYVFPADQLPLHMSKSKIGASYSFYLPWDDVGGPQTEVSLITRFVPKKGAVVCSEQTRQVLPGALPTGNTLVAKGAPKLPEGVPSHPARPRLADEDNSHSVTGVQLASFEHAAADAAAAEEAAGVPPRERHMTTTSISLPDSFRLRGPTANVRAGNAAESTAANARPAPPALPQRQVNLPAAAAQPTAATPQPNQSTSGANQPVWTTGAFASRVTTPPRTNPSFATATPIHALMPAQPPTANGLGWSNPAPQLVTPQQLQQSPPPQQISRPQMARRPLPQDQTPPQSPDANGVSTSVSYLSPAESLQWELGRRSSGSQPPALPAQSQ